MTVTAFNQAFNDHPVRMQRGLLMISVMGRLHGCLSVAAYKLNRSPR